MAFDFLRKKKKYPQNQAAEPPRPEPAPEPAPREKTRDEFSALLDELAEKNREKIGGAVRVYAGPPTGREEAVPVYAGPRPRGPQAVRVYAGPPHRNARSGEDEPDRRPPLEVYAGPPAEWDDDHSSAAAPIYAGPEEMGFDSDTPGPEDL